MEKTSIEHEVDVGRAIALDNIKKARDLISDESRWCRGACAKDKSGRERDPWSDEAAKWCMIGAVYRYKGGYPMWNTTLECTMLANTAAFRKREVAVINDKDGHAAVLKAVDSAIRELECT